MISYFYRIPEWLIDKQTDRWNCPLHSFACKCAILNSHSLCGHCLHIYLYKYSVHKIGQVAAIKHVTTYTIVSVCTETPYTLQCTATFLFAATPSLSSNVDSKCSQYRLITEHLLCLFCTNMLSIIPNMQLRILVLY